MWIVKAWQESLWRLRPFLLVMSILGFLTINCPFLYYAFVERETYANAQENGLALLFMAEAFLLMGFFAYLIARLGWRRPGWIWFVVMSLLGSLAFSIPLFLYLAARRWRPEGDEGG